MDFLLWNGCDGHRPLLVRRDYVLSPLPLFEQQLELLDLGRWYGGVFRCRDDRGLSLSSAEIYGRLLSACEDTSDWVAVCESGEDGHPQVCVLLRDDHRRKDGARERLSRAWSKIQDNIGLRVRYGSGVTFECLSCYGCYRVSFALMHCCRAPIWVMSNREILLQLTYDIITWDINACCKRPMHQGLST